MRGLLKSSREAADADRALLRDKLQALDFQNVTRFEVIDHNGRALTAYGVTVTTSLQDEGRTLKVFIDKRTPSPNPQNP